MILDPRTLIILFYIMSPIKHTIISVGIGAGLSWWLKSWGAGLACLLSGVFIDVDHILDYYFDRKKITFNYKKLYDFCGFVSQGKLFLLFHSYEFIVIGWILTVLSSMNPIAMGIMTGSTIHVLCDHMTNPLRPLALFFSYRLTHKFERKYVFSKEYFKKLL